jgi:hypothetical protein
LQSKTVSTIKSPRLRSGFNFLSIWICLSIVSYSLILLPPIISGTNFVLGDVLVLIGFIAILIDKSARRELLLFYKRGYLFLITVTLLFISVPIIHADDIWRNVLYLVQFLFILIILIPYISISLKNISLSIFCLKIWSLLSIFIYLIGLIFYYYFHSNILIYDSGAKRLILNLFFCGAIPMVFCVIEIFSAKGFRIIPYLILGLIMLIIILSSNRTDLLILLFSIFFGYIISKKNNITLLIFILLIFFILYLWFFSGIQEYTGVMVRDSNIFSDDVRFPLILNAFDRLSENPYLFLFGQGWGTSGEGSESGLVVHNFVIQILLEGGIGALICLTYIFILPICRVIKCKYNTYFTGKIVILQTFSILIFLSLNSISLERRYWISMAIIIGFSYWIKYSKIHR